MHHVLGLKGCSVQERCSAFGLVCPVSVRAVLSGLPGAKGYILPIPTPSWSVCFFQKHLRGQAVVQMICTASSLQYRSPAPSPSSRKYYISDCWFLAYNPYQTQNCGPGLRNICVEETPSHSFILRITRTHTQWKQRKQDFITAPVVCPKEFVFQPSLGLKKNKIRCT